MYIIIYDFGTSNVKAGLFEIASEIKLVAGASASYGLYITANGGAEQDGGVVVGALRHHKGAVSKIGCQARGHTGHGLLLPDAGRGFR